MSRVIIIVHGTKFCKVWDPLGFFQCNPPLQLRVHRTGWNILRNIPQDPPQLSPWRNKNRSSTCKLYKLSFRNISIQRVENKFCKIDFDISYSAREILQSEYIWTKMKFELREKKTICFIYLHIVCLIIEQ